MKSLYITLIYAVVVVSAIKNPTKKPTSDRFPKVVMVKYGKGGICTGTYILDGTVLSSSPCVFSEGINATKLSIAFINDKKTYKVIDANRTDGDLVILKMDKKDNPPKSEWTPKFRKTDQYSGKSTKMILIRSHKNKEKIIMPDANRVEKEGCMVAQVEGQRSNMTRTICIQEGQPWGTTEDDDRGAPLFIDEELTGVLMTPEGSDDPTAFEKLYFHLDFIDDVFGKSTENKNAIKEKDTKVQHRKLTI